MAIKKRKSQDNFNLIKSINDAHYYEYGVGRYEDSDEDDYNGCWCEECRTYRDGDHSDRYWYDYLMDENRLRQEKIDIILGINKENLFEDIMPISLKNNSYRWK